MSNSNDIKNLLDTQDSNISFEGNCIMNGTYKRMPCKYITRELTYEPTHCKYCGVKNEAYTMIKNGTQISRITLPITGVQPTYLRF